MRLPYQRLGFFLVLVFISFAPLTTRADVLDGAVSAITSIFDAIWPDELAEDVSLSFGGGIGTTPDYVGSDNYRFRAVPLIEARYKNIVAFQGAKLRVNVLRHEYIKVGPLVNYMFGREEGRNKALTGLGDIKDTVQFGIFAEGRVGDFIYSADVREATGAGQGTTARLILAHGLYQDNDFLLIGAVRADWGSDQNMQTNFGISPLQSANSVYAPYEANSTVHSGYFFLLGRYQISERWRLDSVAGYTRLFSDAAESPLVQDAGNRNQFLVGSGLRFSF